MGAKKSRKVQVYHDSNSSEQEINQYRPKQISRKARLALKPKDTNRQPVKFIQEPIPKTKPKTTTKRKILKNAEPPINSIEKKHQISLETDQVIGQYTLETLPGARTPPTAEFSPESTLKEANVSLTSTPNKAKSKAGPIVGFSDISSLNHTVLENDLEAQKAKFVEFLEHFSESGKKNKMGKKKVLFDDESLEQQIDQPSFDTKTPVETIDIFVTHRKKSKKKESPISIDSIPRNNKLVDPFSEVGEQHSNNSIISGAKRKKIWRKQHRVHKRTTSGDLLHLDNTNYIKVPFLDPKKIMKSWKRSKFERFCKCF